MGVRAVGYLIGNDMALLHPPKTGGIWARTACASIGLPWMQHTGDGPKSCQHSDTPPPEDRATMVFVRHPVTWLKSYWMYHQRTGWMQYTDSPGFVFYANYRCGEPFPAFVARYLDKMPGAIGRMFDRYTRSADAVGYVESLPKDLAMFINECHPEIDTKPILDLPRLNASFAAQKLTVNYAPGQVDAVCRAEREFMRRWKYKL